MFALIQKLVGRGSARVPPHEAVRLINAGARVLDVREPNEFAQGSLPGAVNVPLSRIQREGLAALGAAGLGSQEPVLLVCRSGMRSGSACAHLRADLGARAVNLSGGLMAWVAAGLPTRAPDMD